MRRQSIPQSRIKCHRILLRVALRDNDAAWVIKHRDAIHELTVIRQAADMKRTTK